MANSMSPADLLIQWDSSLFPLNNPSLALRKVLRKVALIQEFVMGRYPEGPTACVEDPNCKVLITSLKDALPIVVFSFWVIAFIFCGVFQFYKWFHKLKRPVNAIAYKEENILGQEEEFLTNEGKSKAGTNRHNGAVSGDELRVTVGGEIELQFTGFRGSVFGELCYFLACLVSVHWIAIFVLILVDTYNGCEVGGIDNLCFFGNNFIFGTYEFNGKVFFTVWWLAAFWFTVWVVNKGRVHNWFRIPCELREASVVYAWAKDEKEILSVNVFFLVRLLRRVKNVLMPPATRGHFETINIQTTKVGQRYFLYHGQRFLVEDDTVYRAHLKAGNTFAEFYEGEKGLTVQETKSRLEQIGLNEIPFKPESLMFTVYDELLSLFHLYQLLSYLLMFWNSYLFVAALMASIVMISASITIYTRRRSQFAIAKLTEYTTEANVLRDGAWTTVDSRVLVPGDVLRVKSNWLLPCDLLIIQGSCICNESSLTGESMPVQKYAAPNISSAYNPEGQGARHTLFSGTTVLQAGTNSGDDVLAVVSATGMATSKGGLLSSILFPEKMLFKYDEELPIVVTLLLTYAIVCFGIALYFQDHTGAQSFWVTKWIYCMAIINQIMSPLLPVALEVGQLQAVERLKRRGIFCLNPKRIAIAGKIRVFCFDKTGTLTKEGLDFIGIQTVRGSAGNGSNSFGSVQSLEKKDTGDTYALHGLATCHAVTKFGDQFVGNQVEVKMFEAVGWDLIETPDKPPVVRSSAGANSLTIVKRNEFDHGRATMSVIVKDDKGQFHVYCKGSFERLHDLSLSETLPSNYMEEAKSHALDGCYVLGLGHRLLKPGMSLEEVLALSRDELEANLQFVALILFRNELKPDTRGAIEELKAGEVRPLMVTGDNAQCGHYIAKECSLLAPHVQVMLGDIQRDGSVGWSTMSTQEESRVVSTEELLRDHAKGLQGGAVELAVTGKAFTVLRRSEAMENLLFFTRIFARFTPGDKVQVVDMHTARGLIVGMCGDGGNDCGALRSAHAGIALSEAEASVVSPFTSRDKSVVSVVDLLREGRGALHTSFACYKFLITYGLMFSILKLCCYWYGIILCQMDYIFIDGVAVLSLGYAMTLSYPESKLDRVRPTSSLLGPLNVGSVLGLWVLNLFFNLGALLMMNSHSGYVKWPAVYSHGASWWTLGDNWESTVLFFTMYFQFITSAFIFTFGATFRKNVFYNQFLMVTYFGLITFMSVLLLLPHGGLTELWHVASEQFNQPDPISPVWMAYQQNGGLPSPAMPFSFRLSLWGILIANVLAAIVWQKVVAEGPISAALARAFPSNRPKFHL